MKYKYEIRIKEFPNGGHFVSFIFDKKYKLYALNVFFNSAISSPDKANDFLLLIDKVLSGDSDFEEDGGNACYIEIRREKSRVECYFAQRKEEKESTINTLDLKEMIEVWIYEMKEFRKKYPPLKFPPPPDLDLVEDPNVFKSAEEREAYLNELRRLRAELNELKAVDKEKALAVEKELSLKSYEFKFKLPYKAMGICPYCGRIIYRRFDRWGIDGLVKSISDESPEHSRNCAHFYRITAAVNFNGIDVKDIDKTKIYFFNLDLRTGSDMPYVYKFELEKEDKIAVIGSLQMECGYTAYPICYFSEPPQFIGKFPPSYHYHFFKHKFASSRSDEWEGGEWGVDYSLEDWLENGKLKWCDPGSNNKELSKKDPVECPYIYLEGEKLFMEFLSPGLRPPDGSFRTYIGGYH